MVLRDTEPLTLKPCKINIRHTFMGWLPESCSFLKLSKVLMGFPWLIKLNMTEGSGEPHRISSVQMTGGSQARPQVATALSKLQAQLCGTL